MPNKPFHIEALKFVEKLIRQRRYLNKTDRSKGPVARRNEDIDKLDRLVKMNDYRTDKQVAGFYSRHSQEILNIIPANNSLDTYLEQHYALLGQANQILYEKSRTRQPL